MQSKHAAIENDIIAQVVATTQFRKLLNIPVFAWQPWLLVALAYGTVFGGIALYYQGTLPYLLVLVTSVLARYASFTPLHDAVHNALSKNSRLNDWLGTFSAQLIFPGMHCEFYRYLHLEHHQHTGDEQKDPDESACSNSPVKRWLTIVLFDCHLTIWFIKHRHAVGKTQRLKNYLSLATFVVFHLAFLLSPVWQEFLLLWFLPTRMAVVLVTYLFASIQHPHGVVQSERPLQATRMLSDGIIQRHFSLGQSEHLMHHIFPRLPFYRYHKAWKLSQKLLKQRELVWSPTFPLFSKTGRAMPDQALDITPVTLSVVIESLTKVAPDVVSYTLRCADGSQLPNFQAGAHIDVYINDETIRQYSLTGVSASGTYNIAVKLEPEGRGGSALLHTLFCKDHNLRIGLPRNHFSLNNNPGHVDLFAGGIGITPLLAMAEQLYKEKRSFTLHVFARSAKALPFADYLQQVAWHHNVRLYPGSTRQLFQLSDMTRWQYEGHLYLCGPKGFMEYIAQLAKLTGYPESHIHWEQFSAASDSQRKNNKAFKVELARSNREITVSANETLLDALHKLNIPLPASCLQGLCSTCECRVLSGEIEHRDAILSDAQKAHGLMTPCVSRAKSDKLILDL